MVSAILKDLTRADRTPSLLETKLSVRLATIHKIFTSTFGFLLSIEERAKLKRKTGNKQTSYLPDPP